MTGIFDIVLKIITIKLDHLDTKMHSDHLISFFSAASITIAIQPNFGCYVHRIHTLGGWIWAVIWAHFVGNFIKTPETCYNWFMLPLLPSVVWIEPSKFNKHKFFIKSCIESSAIVPSLSLCLSLLFFTRSRNSLHPVRFFSIDVLVWLIKNAFWVNKVGKKCVKQNYYLKKRRGYGHGDNHKRSTLFYKNIFKH